MQQGQRLKNYRQKDPHEKFEPAAFNLVFMTESGQFISGRHGSAFTFSLLNDDLYLQPGRYIILIDPYWNDTSNNDSMYKEVLIDLYGPESV